MVRNHENPETEGLNELDLRSNFNIGAEFHAFPDAARGKDETVIIQEVI